MFESTERLAWTPYFEQGCGSGLHAYRHRFVAVPGRAAAMVYNFNWVAEAEKVRPFYGPEKRHKKKRKK